jgi:hypothetical protein
VRAFPFYPDVPAIMLWLAAAEDDEGEIAALQRAAAAPAGRAVSG